MLKCKSNVKTVDSVKIIVTYNIFLKKSKLTTFEIFQY